MNVDEAGPAETFLSGAHGLYLASVRRDREQAVAAARQLTEATGVDRLLRLHAIASTTNRTPELVLEGGMTEDAVAGAFGAAVAGGEELDGRTPEELAAGIVRFAEVAQRERTGLTPARWRTFLVETRDPGYWAGRDEPEGPGAEPGAESGPATRRAASVAAALAAGFPLVSKPGCNDDEVIGTPGGAAATVRSRFWVDRDLDDAARFIDPKRWVECGQPFWERMAVVENTESPRPPDPARYSAVFDERVRLPTRTVSARLLLRYEKTPDYVLADYRLAGPPHPNDDITFDSGWLYATRGEGPGGTGTYVEGLKAIRFADEELNRFPDLACDGGWVYFMINMALGGTGFPGSGYIGEERVPYTGPPPDLAEVLHGLDGVVDTWLDAMTGSLRRQGEATKAAARRALGPDCDPGWVNDVVGMGHGAVATSQATLHAWRAALAELAKLGGRP